MLGTFEQHICMHGRVPELVGLHTGPSQQQPPHVAEAAAAMAAGERCHLLRLNEPQGSSIHAVMSHNAIPSSQLLHTTEVTRHINQVVSFTCSAVLTEKARGHGLIKLGQCLVKPGQTWSNSSSIPEPLQGMAVTQYARQAMPSASATS
jgi:hypothetical protein